MFDIESGWMPRLHGVALPRTTAKEGWFVDHKVESAFVEPELEILQGDPLAARVIVVAAPGAVGKSTYARNLGALASAVVVDLARTEPLGGNFFVGGVANAFGHQALTDAAEGKIGLVVDALDEAQLRSGIEGFAAGLLDLGKIVRNSQACPAALFGRAAAAEEAWLILEDAGLDTCLLQIKFFDENRALAYIPRKLQLIADRRPTTRAAYEKHPGSFRELAIATRAKLLQTPGGDDERFAGYAPVLDAICEFALDDESLNPVARAAELSAQGPVALIEDIAASILKREQIKVVDQLRREHEDLDGIDTAGIYAPAEQLARVAATLIGAPVPPLPPGLTPELREAYGRMISEFAPQHPFLDGRNGPSNVTFSAYVLVWCLIEGHGAEHARRALLERPGLGSGLLFELYVRRFADTPDVKEGDGRLLELMDVGPLYASFIMQVSQGQQPLLEIHGEAGDSIIEISFEMANVENEVSSRYYGPFNATIDSILEIRGPLGGLRISAPITLIIGDGSAVNITAPIEIEVDTLEIDGREVRVTKAVGKEADSQQVTIVASDIAATRVERIVMHGGRLSVWFPGAQAHPWTDYAAVPTPAPSEAINILRRRLRKVLTSFRSHSRGALVRLAAKIDHARMMKQDDLGPRLVERLRADGILTTFDAGKFYQLHADRMAEALNMDYQALQQQRWTSEADEYLASIADRPQG